MFSETGLGHHESACADPSRRDRHKRQPKRPGFAFCPIHPTRLMPPTARGCFLCEELDAEFLALEDAIRAGINRPRARY
jgi:hypothetical protein